MWNSSEYKWPFFKINKEQKKALGGNDKKDGSIDFLFPFQTFKLYSKPFFFVIIFALLEFQR